MLNKKARHHIQCYICKALLTNNGEELGNHLVAKHGYIKEGNQLLNKRTCSLCDKVALYKFGVHSACKLHRPEIEKLLILHTQKFQRDISGPKQREFDTIERDRKLLDNKRSFAADRRLAKGR